MAAPTQNQPLLPHQQQQQQSYPDHAGLQVVEHSDLEVVNASHHPGGLGSSTPVPPHSSPLQQHQHLYGYPPQDAAPTYPVWEEPRQSPEALIGGGDGGDGIRSGHKERAKESSERRICGLKRQPFWVVVAIAAFILVVGVALGLGLGLGLREHDSDAKPTSSTPTSAGAPAASRVTRYPVPKATVTTTPELIIRCPASNETLYQSQDGSARKFLLLCERDYNSNNGATELFNTQTDSFADCIDRCAHNAGCKAVGWGNSEGINTCWLKSSIGTPHSAAAWYFAVGEEILAASAAAARKRSQLPEKGRYLLNPR